MNYWKNHAGLRMGLIAALFLVSIVMVVSGWRMTGKMAGLGLMVAGVLLLLGALWVYNIPYADTDRPKRRS